MVLKYNATGRAISRIGFHAVSLSVEIMRLIQQETTQIHAAPTMPTKRLALSG